jgi:hypothetical protein
MSFNKLTGRAEQPAKADNAVSKINTDYETSLYAAMASFIIHIYF